MLVRIEGGTRALGVGWFEYRYADTKGEHVYVFSTLNGAIPKIGDSIDTATSTLVVNTKPIINNDPGFQVKSKRRDVWPIDSQDA